MFASLVKAPKPKTASPAIPSRAPKAPQHMSGPPGVGMSNQAMLRIRSQWINSFTRGKSNEHDTQDADREQITSPEAAPNVSWDFSKIPVFGPDQRGRPQTSSPRIQPKLAVGQVNDPLEHEADRIAEQVMRMSKPEIQSQQAGVSAFLSLSPGENIQCLAADRDPSFADAVVIEEGDKEKAEQGQVQTLRPQGQTNGKEMISKRLLNSSQGGVPLESNVQRFMETRFGVDFSRVQVHADSRAAALSQSLDARAFTHGQHIYFNEGEYQPEIQAGKRVIAHELTHVIQQGGGQTRLPVQQHVTENRGANAPATIQRLGALGKALRHNVAPWGSGPTGSEYEVSTDGGSTVPGWKAYPVWEDNFCYWCHGHSLGTYVKYGYSVYSGADMQTVVKDEWTSVAPDKTQAGDIAVWTADFGHSAKFTKPVIESGQLNMDKSELSTKNGQKPLAVRNLTSIAREYSSTGGIAVYRHK